MAPSKTFPDAKSSTSISPREAREVKKDIRSTISPSKIAELNKTVAVAATDTGGPPRRGGFCLTQTHQQRGGTKEQTRREEHQSIRVDDAVDLWERPTNAVTWIEMCRDGCHDCATLCVALGRRIHSLMQALGCARVSLHRAVLEGAGVAEVVTYLEKRKKRYPNFDISSVLNERDGDSGCAPLSVAVKVGDVRAVQILLTTEHIDVNASDEDDQEFTPLHHAIFTESLGMVRILIHHDDIKTNAADTAGITPLMLACEIGNSVIIECLLKESDADPDCTDDMEWDALFYAASRGHTEVVKLLLNDGRIHVLRKDNKGLRAMDYAHFSGYGTIVSRIASENGAMICNR